MKAFIFRGAALFGVLGLLIAGPSCARDQQLVSITVQPDTENFGVADPALNVQLRALGTYIHPPVTKDITNQVTWASNTPNMVTVTPTGLAAPAGFACGSTLISATVTTNTSAGNRSSSGAIVTGFMTANVACVSASGPILTVNFAGLGAGNVVSSPQGLSCTSSAVSCSVSFVSGTPISLTATPISPSTFGGWNGCDSTSGAGQSVCNITSLNANRAVTVTFN